MYHTGFDAFHQGAQSDGHDPSAAMKERRNHATHEPTDLDDALNHHLHIDRFEEGVHQTESHATEYDQDSPIDHVLSVPLRRAIPHRVATVRAPNNIFDPSILLVDAQTANKIVIQFVQQTLIILVHIVRSLGFVRQDQHNRVITVTVLHALHQQSLLYLHAHNVIISGPVGGCF